MQNTVNKQKLFNPSGDDTDLNARQMFKGNSTNLINLNSVKYKWALNLYEQMRENFWRAKKIDITGDVNEYKLLTPTEKRAVNGTLSFLIFLDSLQVQNIGNLKSPVTAPEIAICLSEQLAQEAEHGSSYQYMIETYVPVKERQSIYDFWRDDHILKSRINLISETFQNYIDNPSEENYFKALIADYVLEGLYFYHGFIVFYCLASRSRMGGSTDIIKLIHRDELSHVRLYQEIIKEIIINEIFPVDHQWVKSFFFSAARKDIEWNKHIIGDDFLGITRQSIENYAMYLANIRIKAIGFDPIFDDVYNPYKHLEKIADNTNKATTKVNFFDSNQTSYVMSSAVDGFDDF